MLGMSRCAASTAPVATPANWTACAGSPVAAAVEHVRNLDKGALFSTLDLLMLRVARRAPAATTPGDEASRPPPYFARNFLRPTPPSYDASNREAPPPYALHRPRAPLPPEYAPRDLRPERPAHAAMPRFDCSLIPIPPPDYD